jgi:hypothetical protein
MSKRVADVIVETLQAAGVKRCYGIVGDTLNRIAHAIHESKIAPTSVSSRRCSSMICPSGTQVSCVTWPTRRW